MKLSVLVCSVAERQGRTPVLDQLWSQAEGKDVEVLVLTDNRQMSIGAKRNALVAASSGDYVVFVDDDDRVADNYIDALLAAATTRRDVLTFTMEYRYNGEKQWIARQSLGYPLQGKRVRHDLVRITPHHTSAVRRDIATRLTYQDSSYGEDRDWARQLRVAARTECVIPETLYIYDDVPRTSIARQYARDYDPAAYEEWERAQ